MTICENQAHAEIVMDGHGRGKVMVDGKEVRHVAAASLNVGVQDVNLLSVTMTIPTASFNGDVELRTELSEWPEAVQRSVFKALQELLEPAGEHDASGD